MSGFQTPITIRTAMEKIHNRDFLLPAIQRKFVWKHNQVELLFYSIMRGYPINSFMFWVIKEDSMKSVNQGNQGDRSFSLYFGL